MICKHCGKEIKYNATKCKYCGASTADAAPAPRKKVNVFGIIGFIGGILSLFFSIYYCIPSAVGLIFSIIGLVFRKKYRYSGLAIAGLVMNVLSLVVWGAFWIFLYSLIKALQQISCQPV